MDACHLHYILMYFSTINLDTVMSSGLQCPPELGEDELVKDLILTSVIFLGSQADCVANIISLVTLKKLKSSPFASVFQSVSSESN